MSSLKTATRWYDSIMTHAAFISALTAYGLVAMVCADVILRKFFRAPLLWSQEASGFGLITLGMFGAGYTLVTGGHINLDILVTHLRPRGKAITNLFASCFSLTYLIVLCVVTWDQAISSIGHTTSGIMMLPIFPAKVLLPIASALLALGVVIGMVRDISKIRSMSNEAKI